MKQFCTTRPARKTRGGATLVIVALLLPVLLGLLGLVIDGGLLMAAYRQSRNAADAAALAAAQDLIRGRSSSTATATATAFVQNFNGLSAATVTVHNPPSSGPYTGNHAYVEVQISRPFSTFFIQALGVNREQAVVARAVAGYEPAASGARVVALNPAARPGLSVSGGGVMLVNGAVAVNSEGGGVDENGRSIGNGNTGFAATVSNNGTFRASSLQTVGGVNTPSNFKAHDTSAGSPLRAGSPSHPDPLLYLPPPTTANGADPTVWPAVNITGNQAVTLYPGVYPSINIASGAVVFQPGIYIIRGGALKITEQDVKANGSMFYITGSDYNVNTGLPDAGDLSAPPSRIQ